MENKLEAKMGFYQEPYRNQFHFSPKVGWMNDINGLWYKNGLYHLTYQADYDNLQPVSIGWGHAISDDMIHWKQLPMALQPGVNTKGQAFSGSVIFDIDNTAGFGENTVILIYTDTVLGQCMNWFNETTNEFVPYESNPIVAMDEAGIKVDLEPAAQRDPKVFWDTNTNSWIMIVFRERDEILGSYLQLYRSKDLKEWERLDNFVAEGFCECPNLYSLKTEEGETKWILQSASGRYCVGHFDGEHLIVEDDHNKCMINGRAYAGQSYMGLSNGRLVYMAWLENWGGVTVETKPWRNSASVPFELSLKKLSDGSYHIYANPIEELKTLYNVEHDLGTKHIIAGENIFETCFGKQFDVSFVLDFNESNAKKITINIKGKSFILDIENSELVSNVELTNKDSWANHEWKAHFDIENGVLNVRILADSDCFEVIFGKGKAVYFEECAFDRSKNDFSVIADDNVIIKEAFYADIKSIWQENSI